jgi:hypothetical protein|tara:strand:+ start:266 stop:445 length:180 start_codon:yes stop_codon:yes gene_type:complete
MGMTDKVVGTGMLSFITMGGEAVREERPAEPKEPAEEQTAARQEQLPDSRDGQPPAEKQ